MAYYCIKNSSLECDGCMCCKPEPHYYCPICGKEVFETVYVSRDGDVLGCENCTVPKEPDEVLENEADE